MKRKVAHQTEGKPRKVVFFKHYFKDFFEEQNEQVQSKILWTLKLIEDLPRVPSLYFEHMENTDGLYEIRVGSGGNIFRIFSFFDKGNLVVVGNGFQKKTQKTPAQELEMALKIKKEYEDSRK